MKNPIIKEINEAEFNLQQLKKEYLLMKGWKNNRYYPKGIILWSNTKLNYTECSLGTAYKIASYKDQNILDNI